MNDTEMEIIKINAREDSRYKEMQKDDDNVIYVQ
jgi:hypothetical protein